MQTRPIGSLDVTVVGLGTNNFGMGMAAGDVPPVVHAALDAGINFFDTSDSYGESEVRLGAALWAGETEWCWRRSSAARSAARRGAGAPGRSTCAARSTRSLRRLRTDRIDLYQLHRPDPKTPIADTLGALAEMVAAGKVLEIGCSNFTADQIREADAAAGHGPRFVSVQNEYNLLNRADEADVLPLCEELGIAYLPYFPLASGMLTGKYRRGEAPADGTRIQRWGPRADDVLTDDNFEKVDALRAWAEGRGRTILDLAFAWLLAKPVVASVIAGATRPDQVRANAGAAGWALSADEVAEVDKLAGS